MNTFEAFARGQASRDNPIKTFDWLKAAQLIRESNPSSVDAGLIEDWFWTGGTIYSNGEPQLDTYAYLSSTWATPTIVINGEQIPCWQYEKDVEWDSDTKWPQVALDILNKGI
jgi:hypothetical protein